MSFCALKIVWRGFIYFVLENGRADLFFFKQKMGYLNDNQFD